MSTNETTALHQAITKGQLAADVLYALGYHFEALHGKKPRWVAPRQDNVEQAVKALKDALKAQHAEAVQEEDILSREQRLYIAGKTAALQAGRCFAVSTHLVPSWHKYRETRRVVFSGMVFKALEVLNVGPDDHPTYRGPAVLFEIRQGIYQDRIWLPLECVRLL